MQHKCVRIFCADIYFWSGIRSHFSSLYMGFPASCFPHFFFGSTVKVFLLQLLSHWNCAEWFDDTPNLIEKGSEIHTARPMTTNGVWARHPLHITGIKALTRQLNSKFFSSMIFFTFWWSPNYSRWSLQRRFIPCRTLWLPINADSGFWSRWNPQEVAVR